MESFINLDYNLYDTLQCDQNSTFEELKSSFQRLAKKHHPDKNINDNLKEDEEFVRIRKAWDVLKVSELRKKYDAHVRHLEASEDLLYETLALSDMDYDETNETYSYSCRCGGNYTISKIDLSDEFIIGCNECSFSILVRKNR